MCDRCQALEADKRIPAPNRPGFFLRRCDRCKAPIPLYENMGGAGFRSHTVDHYHEDAAGRKTLQTPVMLELCHACYLQDYAAFYPGAELPDIANVKV
jgi:hypothetical protein